MILALFPNRLEFFLAMFKNIKIEKLEAKHADSFSRLLQGSDKEYSMYFVPFSFETETIKKLLQDAVDDKYFGIFVDSTLVGFYMLRGFDEGFEIPSYGVWIAKEYSGFGLSQLTLQHAISYCKLNGIEKIMLKVHKDNLIAKNIYEKFGFVQEGFDEKINNIIYYKNLK
jgi:RimJ/RimL family protein N-acetyltransferase